MAVLNYKSETQNTKELDQFLEFIREQRIDLYLEIGLYSGSTFKAVFDTLMDVHKGDRTKFRMIGVDLPQNHFAFQECCNVLEEIAVVPNKNTGVPYSNVFTYWTSSTDPATVEQVISDVQEWYSKDVELRFQTNSLVFIDGEHTYNQSRDDYLAYKDFFRWVAFNDISPGTVMANRKKHPSIGNRDVATVYHLYEALRIGPHVKETYIVDHEADKPRGIGILEGLSYG